MLLIFSWMNSGEYQEHILTYPPFRLEDKIWQPYWRFLIEMFLQQVSEWSRDWERWPRSIQWRHGIQVYFRFSFLRGLKSLWLQSSWCLGQVWSDDAIFLINQISKKYFCSAAILFSFHFVHEVFLFIFSGEKLFFMNWILLANPLLSKNRWRWDDGVHKRRTHTKHFLKYTISMSCLV